ncbi:hypothetical protein AVEN_215126-1 [Araneus ventricosus]|uniref:Mos1 transposase HTH domain-containing protein n=1 Tax=Araneus ventricosus TaxID=182803 RepID=A0A4Y2JF48_ARAVE|nr:hypothetical protein AVEN_215126-1 [Araneus ventricosus]
MSIAVLCFLGLFVVVQGLSLETKILVKYEKFWNYAICLSNGTSPQRINECIKILRPEYEGKSKLRPLQRLGIQDLLRTLMGCDHQAKKTFSSTDLRKNK